VLKSVLLGCEVAYNNKHGNGMKIHSSEDFTKNWAVINWWHTMLGKYISGKLTDDEKKLVEDWQVPEVPPGYFEIETIQRLVRSVKSEVFGQLFSDTRIPQTACRRTRSRSVKSYAVAAVLVVLILTGTTFFIYKNQNAGINQPEIAQIYYSTSDQQRQLVTLPDGSTVHLNGGTRIHIEKNTFNKVQRDVWIDDGEAFFEVTKNPQKVFVVHASNLTTTVKGTSFNVNVYRELATSVVMVRTGKVEVNSGGKTLGVLTSGQQLVYSNQDGQFSESPVLVEDIAAWDQGKLILKNADFSELRLRIRQLYGLELKVQGNIMDEKHISSSFNEGASIQNIMESIRLLHGVNYRITDKQILIYQ
jgi:transmembrane sensor